jgi:AbrB family looped-hinge helix DNA binding protein
MHWTTTVTQKGQITIPQAFRKALGIQPYDSVVIELQKGKAIITPKKDLLDLAGTLVPPKNKGKSIKQARDAFESNYERF